MFSSRGTFTLANELIDLTFEAIATFGDLGLRKGMRSETLVQLLRVREGFFNKLILLLSRPVIHQHHHQLARRVGDLVKQLSREGRLLAAHIRDQLVESCGKAGQRVGEIEMVYVIAHARILAQSGLVPEPG